MGGQPLLASFIGAACQQEAVGRVLGLSMGLALAFLADFDKAESDLSQVQEARDRTLARRPGRAGYVITAGSTGSLYG
jgi:hypothetical protein